MYDVQKKFLISDSLMSSMYLNDIFHILLIIFEFYTQTLNDNSFSRESPPHHITGQKHMRIVCKLVP